MKKRQPRVIDLSGGKAKKKVEIISDWDEVISIKCHCGQEVDIPKDDKKSVDCPKCGIRYIKSLL